MVHTPHLGGQGPRWLTCARPLLFPFKLDHYWGSAAYWQKLALPLVREPSSLGNSGTINQFITAYLMPRPLLDLFVQVNMLQCFILHGSIHFWHTPLPKKSKNYWRKKSLCFLNFMGTPTASSSQNTMRARHCHCCGLVFLLECKSQGSEFPYCRGTWNSSGNCSFFSHLFHKPACTMVTTGKDPFYFFLSAFPLVLQ